jgi:hypothetical protein
MARITRPALYVDGALCRLIEEDGILTAETWGDHGWIPGGEFPFVILHDGTKPTADQLRRFGLDRLPA